MKYGYKCKYLITMLCCLLLLCVTLIPKQVYAEDTPAAETQDKVVRVGWYQSDLFQEGTSDEEEKSGYSYQYLQKIASYNGWTYEYVYGDWTELFAQFEAGDIDVLAGVSDTEEREAYMSFPSAEMGSENYCLYQHESNKTMDVSDMSTFHGQKIGAITDNLMTTYLEQWIADNGVDLELVYYSSFDERDQDFNAGKLDGIVSTDNNVLADSDCSLVTSVGQEPYYLAVTKSRPDLLEDLNNAISLMQQLDPYFLQNLQYDSYGTNLSNTTFTEIEKEWLNSHDTLKVGYMENYMPYCATDDAGNVTGLIKDVLSAALSVLGIDDQLQVSYQGFSDNEEMLKALKNGQIDVAFPVGGSTWDNTKDGINATSAVVTCGMNLVYKGKYTGTDQGCFAINKNNKLQYNYVRRNFPNAEMVTYDSIDQCLNAVENGNADFTIINGLRTNLIWDSGTYSDLSVMQLQENDVRAMGVKHGNSGLLILLNRGLNHIGEDYGTNAGYNYSNQNDTETFAEFIRDHMKLVLLIGLAIVAFITISFIVYTKGINRARRATNTQLAKNRELTGQLEAQNRALELSRDAAEAANRAKTAFLFNMSHDIRTPMNAIIGFTELLKIHKNDPEKIEDDIEKLSSSGQFLLSLINNVLEVARIESGNTSLNEDVLDLKKFGNDLYAVFDEQMKKKQIVFTETITATHPLVYGDSVKLRQIFLNILSNAYKYTPQGGCVSMIMEEVPCDRQGYAMFRTTISDTGIGMSAEFLPHIFEEFSREKSVTDNKIEGTGLGMPIVKKLVTLMNGSIEVESALGKGSTFVVTLCHKIAEEEQEHSEEKILLKENVIPEEYSDAEEKISTEEKLREEEKVGQEEELQTISGTLEGKRILLAEDNELNAEIAVAILSEAGLEVERAADGQICLDMLMAAEDGYYDAILMDIQMPNMNGYEATKQIRALSDPAKAGIPILAMTANAFEEDKKNALEAGMDAHLAKPIEVHKVLATLSLFLNN